MGTTQRIAPGVSGQPNWGDLNKAITHIAKSVEDENTLENDDNIDSDRVHKQLKKIGDRQATHVKSAYRGLVKTGGGIKTISSGNSKSIGKSGISAVKKLVGFSVNVNQVGLEQALIEVGFGSLAGKSLNDVIDFLLIHCSDTSAGMDETAANKATSEILEQIAVSSENDVEKFEETLQGYVEENGLADILCNFFGLYIYEHLSQRFEEKITQQKGVEVSKQTFTIIKEDILGQVKRINESRPVNKIAWGGAEGKEKIESIFESIIKIICE